jgi:hypothetical protein
MALLTQQPTANQTPDATQGGSAVTGISNTGHSSTTSSASVSPPIGSASSSQTKTARWFTFADIFSSFQVKSKRLKLTWTASGSAGADNGADGDADATSSFTIQYTLNGGGSWTTIVTDSAIASAPGTPSDSFTNNNSADILLSSTQDITQVQVRDNIAVSVSATTNSLPASATGSSTVTISSIRLEVEVVDTVLLVMM